MRLRRLGINFLSVTMQIDFGISITAYFKIIYQPKMLMSFGNSAIQINGKNGCLVEDNYIENLYT